MRPAAVWGAVVLFVLGSTSLTVGLRGHQHGLPAPVAAAAAPSAPVRTPTLLGRSAPIALRIPAIGVSVSVTQLGLKADGTVQVPGRFSEPGWFREGPTPGQLGSAVILGHVDSYKGPAVFFRLRELRPGDLVEVTLADGAVARFAVDRVAVYRKTSFPAQEVYGSHGSSALQLVTCGGAFDRRTRSYLSNVVVYTELVSASAPRAAARESGTASAPSRLA